VTRTKVRAQSTLRHSVELCRDAHAANTQNNNNNTNNNNNLIYIAPACRMTSEALEITRSVVLKNPFTDLHVLYATHMNRSTRKSP